MAAKAKGGGRRTISGGGMVPPGTFRGRKGLVFGRAGRGR